MYADEKVLRPLPPDQYVDLAVELFRMLADPTRVRLLWALGDGEVTVNRLADLVGKPAASVSQHLAKLRLARVVTTRRDGAKAYYSVPSEHVRQLVLDAVHNAEHLGAGLPPHHAEPSR